MNAIQNLRRFYSRFIKTTVIEVYASTNEADDEVKGKFYEQVQKIVDGVPRHDKSNNLERKTLKESLVCQEKGVTTGNVLYLSVLKKVSLLTMFPHNEIHRYSWTSPNGQHHNQSDHAAVRSNFKRSVQDVRACRGVDYPTVHNLVIAKTLFKRSRTGRRGVQVRRYENSQLNMPRISKQFQLESNNRFSCLSKTTKTDTKTRAKKHTITKQRISGKRSENLL